MLVLMSKSESASVYLPDTVPQEHDLVRDHGRAPPFARLDCEHPNSNYI